MPKPKKTVIEFRNYDLKAHFPILLLTGDHWRISDIPSGRLHIHNCLEIGLCESDSGFLKFNNQEYPFQAGDITAISCDIPHTTYSSPGTASQWSYLFVDLGELFHPMFPGINLSNGKMLGNLENRVSLIMGSEEYPSIHRLAWEIVEELKKKEDNYEISVRGLFLALVTQLSRIMEKNRQKQERQPENALAIAPALEYIRYHYMEDFPMEDLAGLCGISSTHFRRVFSSIIGVSPLEHLISTRIRKAADLLCITEAAIVDISERVGFHSLSSFNRHFLAIMGQTPSEWRRNMSLIKDQSVLKYNGWMFAENLKRY